jgi:hypothetical protein
MEPEEFKRRKEAVAGAIISAIGCLTFLPVNRETALVKTKLEEAQMWLERYAYLNQG